MTESQWRFLKAIAERVPEERIVEVRLFPTIRQGGAESGVAVVAVEEVAAALAGAEPVVAADVGDESAAAGVLDEPGAATMTNDAAVGLDAQDVRGERGAPPETDDTAVDAADHHQFISTQVDSSRGVADQAPADQAPADHDPVADWLPLSVAADHEPSPRLSEAEHRFAPQMADLPEPVPADLIGDLPRPHPALADSVSATEHEVAFSVGLDNGEFEAPEDEPTPSLDDILDLAAASAASAAVAKSARMEIKRYAVLAARYRLTLKGPDRGKWDFEITHEADAPLDTIDRVARGVARRAGDAGDPESLSAPQLRSTLSQPWWSTAP